METGAQLILGERQRQASEEGWTFEHDDRQQGNMLALITVTHQWFLINGHGMISTGSHHQTIE